MRKVAALIVVITTAVAIATQINPASVAQQLSPAEQSMATAQQLIEKNAKNYEAYNALALALSRRARETSDVKFYSRQKRPCRSRSPSLLGTLTESASRCGCCWAGMNLPRPWPKPRSST